ncbi:hypothetical protein Emin_0818 [Elusimicrobium minutum Pei191]|uniref:DUF2207 domain-containing protein n=1 Tax=Elusimicrobium minutum (strain Pei191) TaxID=445932 RepID=B2KCX7_ELUMP|nr:DUF2207 domain-containing protein [Elusimicrobium minutum]ACC98373.1 hypothetical protein Emin_0818 [Elusimicrobium minutum Pei191]
MKKIYALLILLSALPGLNAAVLTDYKADITLADSPAVLVKEKLVFDIGEDETPDTFFKDFNTIHNSALWVKKDKDFKILSVEKDGQPVAYTEQNTPNSKRIFIDSSDLKKGSHEYTVYYKTSLIKFYSDSDELYIDTTGSFNKYNPSNISVTVNLPKGVIPVYLKTLYGVDGKLAEFNGGREYSEGKLNFNFENKDNKDASVIISLGLPKGTVSAPAVSEFHDFMADNKKIVLPLLIIFTLLIYYIIVWIVLRNRKPQEDKTVSTPPSDLSVAAVRYLYKKNPGQIKDRYKMLTSSILNMAVNGILKIVLSGKNIYLEKTGKENKSISEDEKALLSVLFEGGAKKFTPADKTSKEIQSIISAHKKNAKEHVKSKYIRSDKALDITGYVLGLLGFIFLLFSSGGGILYLGSMFIFIIITVITFRRFFPPFTDAGIEKISEIEGFRKFLSGSDNNGQAKLDNDVFAKYLPYAVALGVEHKWVSKYAAYVESVYSETQFNWCEIDFGSELFEEHHTSKSGQLAFIAGSGLVEEFSKTKNISYTEDL